MQLKVLLITLGVMAASLMNLFAQQPERWTAEKANAWYAQQPWMANYVPSDAINQLEMFQAATWNPALNDRELGLAQSVGMNVVRVFLQDQLWEQDAAGFRKRLDEFLGIASRHGIRVIFVLFDSCWDPMPRLGPQHPPIPGVHNSGWVQSPGAQRLADPSYEPRLKEYVTGVVGAFASDERVLAWDVWNEPNNEDSEYYRNPVSPRKTELVNALLPKVFAWARSVRPVQPLTSGVWYGSWTEGKDESPTTRIQLAQSDIVTFHNYDWPEAFEERIKELMVYGRPVLCTEFMARGAGSTFDGDLPVAKKYGVAAINWGLVAGKTQTWLPWDSWQRPYVLQQPAVWFHEVFRQDGTPYREHEADLMRRLTGRGTPAMGTLRGAARQTETGTESSAETVGTQSQ
jgi:hypothetical protein